jgi:Lipase (class 3)
MSFVSGLHGTGSDRRLYVTGHSKGGALATLAALDLPDLVGNDVKPVVYTFACAKALTADNAAQSARAISGMWRFKHENDIVLSLPPDSTVDLWNFFQRPFYAHVGNLAYFAKGRAPDLSQAPANGVDPPGELKKVEGIGRKPANLSNDELALLRGARVRGKPT